LIDRLEALLDSDTTDLAELGAVRDLREAIANMGNAAAHWLGDEPISSMSCAARWMRRLPNRAARAGRFGITFAAWCRCATCRIAWSAFWASMPASFRVDRRRPVST
jgi:hypothetical protein